MPESEHPQTVVVTDVHVPFWSMVVFMVKWAIAAIPAVVILVVIFSVSSALLATARVTYSEYRSAAEQKERARNEEAARREAEAAAAKAWRPLASPTESERRCAAGGGDYQKCLQSERRCAGSSDREKCLEEDKRLDAISAARRAAEASGAMK